MNHPIAEDGTLFTWFRAGASGNPAVTALEVAGAEVTYQRLLDLAERLAYRVAAAAGGRPRVVALLTGRSLAAYAGYLAALRLAATVVPLNAEAPVARNVRICRSSGVEVVVGDHVGAARLADLAERAGAACLPLDAGWPARPDLASASARWSAPYDGDPDGVAYILHTSGSTGEPKGIPIRHRHVQAFLAYCAGRYAPAAGDRFAQTFDLTFDPSVFDTFLAWCAGATLVVAQPAEVLSAPRFVATRRITHWLSVPSVISVTRKLRLLRPGSMPGLRASLFMGEQLSLGQAAAWAAAAPGSVIGNAYGPTELTINCAGYELPAGQSRWPETSNGTVPIGRIYPHLEGALLSGQQAVTTEPWPDGAEGELCVRGSQRFDGYLDPAQDTGRFVRVDGGRATGPGQAPPRPGARRVVADDLWYRTGDRVRVEGGQLVHLGRLDDQVKIRGQRTELGEIESVLREHPKLLDVAVLALPAPGGDGDLELRVAYTGEAVDDAELAAHAAAKLPPYMVPERYRHLGEMPLNANGKTDRRRLAADLAAAG